MNHPLFARVYARTSVAENRQQEVYRRELVAGLHGRVLEVGCGNGLNLAYYPPTVRAVVAVEPDAYLRRRASQVAAPVPVTVLAGSAEQLRQVVEGPFDAVVFSLVLCSVGDPAAVLAETTKVLRPGATARFYEHVISDDPRLARWQRRASPWWRHVAGGCRPDRDLLAAVAGQFSVDHVRHFDFCAGPRVPLGLVAPRVLAQGTYAG